MPALLRWLMPDADHATAGAADARRLLASTGAAGSSMQITAEGASVALRLSESYEDVARYTQGGG